MIANVKERCKFEEMTEAVSDLMDGLYEAMVRGDLLHVVERDIVQAFVQKVGRLSREGYIKLQWTGDIGPSFVSREGQELDGRNRLSASTPVREANGTKQTNRGLRR